MPLPVRSHTVRSYSKINLGLAIGPPRPDGFHSLVTLYQTLALHDDLTLVARPALSTRITLRSNDPRVPTDARNTVWKMIVRALDAVGRTAEVTVHIQKNLPIQGGMGAGSANAAAALIALEKALNLSLSPETRLRIAAEVGSDVPLFLLGGSVLGSDRGQVVVEAPAVTFAGEDQIPCVIALPGIGVSTPNAFRDWDLHLHGEPIQDTLGMLSRTFASVFAITEDETQSGASGIASSPGPAFEQAHPENLQEPCEQLHPDTQSGQRDGSRIDLAENSLLALVRTGIENDFETVVFPQYPLLGDIKRHLTGHLGTESAAIYAALSGSGSAIFGLYRAQAHAQAAQQRLQQHGVQALVTTTLPRPLYWANMFAE